MTDTNFLRIFGLTKVLQKCTLPSASANKVWSRPIPTFSPGWTGVPRCRMMIFPEVTACPPNFFTPNRFPLDLRPFFVDPPAFFVAKRTVWLNKALLPERQCVWGFNASSVRATCRSSGASAWKLMVFFVCEDANAKRKVKV